MLRKPRPRYESLLNQRALLDRASVRMSIASIRRPARFRQWLDALRVKPKELRWYCDPRKLPFQSSSELAPMRRVIGQGKAMKALAMGLRMESPGYNLFVCGLPGTGRSTAVRSALVHYRRADYRPLDLGYVPNREAPERPRLLAFPAGEGERFRREVNDLLQRAHALGSAAEGTAGRRALRVLLENRIRELHLAYPGEGVARYLEELGRSVAFPSGPWSPFDFGMNLIS